MPTAQNANSTGRKPARSLRRDNTSNIGRPFFLLPSCLRVGVRPVWQAMGPWQAKNPTIFVLCIITPLKGWGYPDLTDTGLRVKNPRGPHENTDQQTSSCRTSYAGVQAEALSLRRTSGRSAAKVAAELGIRPPLLYRWAHTERVPDQPGAEGKPRRSIEGLEAEVRRLREENAKLLEQREVLKKSLGIPSEVPLRGTPGSKP